MRLVYIPEILIMTSHVKTGAKSLFMSYTHCEILFIGTVVEESKGEETTYTQCVGTFIIFNEKCPKYVCA